MEPRIVQVPSFTVLGLRRKQSNDHPELIGKQWADFHARGGPEQIPEKLSGELVAVYTDYEGDHTQPYTLTIGCQIEHGGTLPNGLSVTVIPEARYAVFEGRGPQPATVVETWQRIYASKITRAFTTDFERYHGPEHLEVFVAVR